MPTYTIKDPQTGRSVKLTGDSPPTEAELTEIFATLGASQPAPASQAAPENALQGSAAGRFLSNAGEMVNPVAIAKGLYGAVRHPIETAGNIVSAQVDQGRQAVDMFKQGRYSEAAGRAGAAMLPILGPAAAMAGEQIAEGDVAGGLGKGAGILATTLVPAAVRAGTRAVNRIPQIAEGLDQGAAARVTDVMAPKVGANKVRLGNRAEAIAPALAKDLATDGAPLTRTGFHARVAGKLADAEQALDAASDARLSARTFPTKPLIDALLEKRKQFTSEAVEGSQAPRTSVQRTSPIVDARGQPISVIEQPRQPIGQNVVPGPNAPRVAQIDRAIDELRKLGPVTRYDPIRTMRQAYDGPAKVVYSPAVTADYLAARGSALGAADVTGTLREALAKWDPETAAANAQYALYRTADDVLSAAAEVERVRPRVGRQIISRMTGTLLGQQTAGAGGAVAGYIGGPLVDAALSGGLTTQLKTAALMTKLATAIRKADVAKVYSLTGQLKAATKQASSTAAAIVGNTTSPSESRSRTTAPATP